MLETDSAKARELGRKPMEGYLKLPNYVNNLRALGYADADFAHGGSEQLVGSSHLLKPATLIASSFCRAISS